MIETPHLPDDPHQPRPALVVSEDRRNGRRNSVIVVPIFSSGALGPTHIALPSGVGGIAHSSVLFGEEVAALHKMYLVDGPLGPPVSLSLLGRVNRAIRRALGEVVQEPS
jgi:mRNA-degrading endonuclease toxin of MazEF toxin-antitoxin module